MEDLIRYLKMTQKELKRELFEFLKNKGMKPISANGFLYAEGEIPVLLVAHLDTVANEPPKYVFYYQPGDTIYNPYGILGGDDRCGIYAITKLLEKFKPYVLFTEDEEIGCIGARAASKKLDAPNVKYIIEFDRKGRDDCVFYQCGNDKFIKYVEGFGFKKNIGSCSDISVIGSAWNIGSVNLSSGYYREHTSEEYVIFGELLRTIKRAEKMLKIINYAPYFDYQEIKYDYSYLYGYYSEDVMKKIRKYCYGDTRGSLMEEDNEVE